MYLLADEGKLGRVEWCRGESTIAWAKSVARRENDLVWFDSVQASTAYNLRTSISPILCGKAM